MSARERFESCRRAVNRLDVVHALLAEHGDDWQPDEPKAAHETSDPTANRAIYNVDVLAEQLDALRAEERELMGEIAQARAIIRAVREGFGEIYANVLEARYIERVTWAEIYGRWGIPRSTGHYLVNVAFDWIDSVGISRLLKGDTEL